MNNTVEKWLFWISQGKVATVYRWSGQVYKLLMSIFFQDLTHQKSLKSVNIWPSYLKNKNVSVFFGTQCRSGAQPPDVCRKKPEIAGSGQMVPYQKNFAVLLRKNSWARHLSVCDGCNKWIIHFWRNSGRDEAEVTSSETERQFHTLRPAIANHRSRDRQRQTTGTRRPQTTSRRYCSGRTPHVGQCDFR